MKKKLKKIIQHPKFLGNIAYFVSKILQSTMRIQVHKDVSIDANQPYLFAFWHGKQFFPSSILIDQHDTVMCAMVSPSRDGEILTTLLEKYGYAVLRGSSRDQNVRALLGLKKSLESGASVGFGIDGPIGPIYEVKPGIVYLAQKLQIPIIPLGSYFSNKWIFSKAWDKFQLPKPFSTGGFYLGKPIIIGKNDDLEASRTDLAKQINAAEQAAQDLLFSSN